MKCKVCGKEVDKKEVKRVYTEMVADFGCCSAGCYTQAISNAKLIASAPDLLEACKEADKYFDSLPSWCISEFINELWLKLQQAIAKAEGK
jgi:hypothetical protein